MDYALLISLSPVCVQNNTSHIVGKYCWLNSQVLRLGEGESDKQIQDENRLVFRLPNQLYSLLGPPNKVKPPLFYTLTHRTF